MLRLWFLALADPAASISLDLKSWRVWISTALAIAGSVGGWKLVGYLWTEVFRGRIDRFIFDARKRHRTLEAEIVLAVFVDDQPAVDQSRLASMRRHPAEVREIVKSALVEEFKTADSHNRSASEALQLAQANASAIEGLSAAQLAQGHVLAQVPHMAGVLETIAASMEGLNESLRDMNARQESTARDVGRILGSIEERRRQFPNGEDRQFNRRVEDRARMARDFEHDEKPSMEPTE